MMTAFGTAFSDQKGISIHFSSRTGNFGGINTILSLEL
jgi:hypothetical protein